MRSGETTAVINILAALLEHTRLSVNARPHSGFKVVVGRRGLAGAKAALDRQTVGPLN